MNVWVWIGLSSPYLYFDTVCFFGIIRLFCTSNASLHLHCCRKCGGKFSVYSVLSNNEWHCWLIKDASDPELNIFFTPLVFNLLFHFQWKLKIDHDHHQQRKRMKHISHFKEILFLNKPLFVMITFASAIFLCYWIIITWLLFNVRPGPEPGPVLFNPRLLSQIKDLAQTGWWDKTHEIHLICCDSAQDGSLMMFLKCKRLQKCITSLPQAVSKKITAFVSPVVI